MIETINKLMRVQKQLVQEYGREPSPDEVAEEVLLPVDRVRAVLKMAQQPISLQSPVGESEETNFGDFIEDRGAENPSDMTAIVLLKEKIKDVLETLTDRERQVLEQRFGLVDGYSRTLEEVGRQFQVTRERIRQIEAKALRKMRHPTRIRQLRGFLEAPELQRLSRSSFLAQLSELQSVQFTERIMNREDDQELWDLLGHPAEPELSPFFARNLARQVRQDGSRSERMRKWLSLRRLIPAHAVAIALMAPAIASYHPSSQKTSEGEPDVVAKIDPQDYEVVADLDELIALDENSLWDEKTTL